MKKLRFSINTVLYLLLVVWFFPMSVCFSQWQWLNPLPQGNDLQDVCFVDASTAFAVGYGGTILKTIDSGLTWEHINSGTIYDLISISFVNENVGYLCGNSEGEDIGFVFKTVNGGNNWNLISDEFWATLTSIYFTDESTGYLCGTWNVIFKTTDGGVSWFPLNVFPGDDFLSIYFTDENTGYLGGDVSIYKTTDAGDTWYVTYNDPNSPLFRSFCFTSSDTGCKIRVY